MKAHITKLFLAFYVPYLALSSIMLCSVFDITLFDTLLMLIITLPASLSGNTLPTIVGLTVAWVLNFIVYRTQLSNSEKHKSWMVLSASVAAVEFIGLIIHFAKGNQAWKISLFYAMFFAVDAFIQKKKMQKSNETENIGTSYAPAEETLIEKVDSVWRKTGSSDLFKMYLKHRDNVLFLENKLSDTTANYNYLFAYSYYLTYGYKYDKHFSKHSPDAVTRAIISAFKSLRIIDGHGYIESVDIIESYKKIYKHTLNNLK